MKQKKITIEHNPSNGMGKPYRITGMTNAVLIQSTFVVGDWLNEREAKDIAELSDWEVTVKLAKN